MALCDDLLAEAPKMLTMKQTALLKILTFCVIELLVFQFSYSQSNITATVSQRGLVNFRVTVGGDHIDISERGNISGFGSVVSGSITYDFNGRADRIGTTTASYDYKDRLDRLGSISITYEFKGRVDKVANHSVSYDFNGRLEKIGDLNITYDFQGRIDKIRDANIFYDFNGRVVGIDDDKGIIIFKVAVGGY